MLDVLLTIYKQVTCDRETAIAQWQTVEACLYAFTAIAEPLQNHDSHPHIKQLMSSLGSLPYEQIDQKAAIAAMDTIGIQNIKTIIILLHRCTYYIYYF